MAICNQCNSILSADTLACKKCGSVLYGEGSEIFVGDKVFRRYPAEHLNPWEYYLKCFRKYFSFGGRASRKEFWSFFCINILILILLNIIKVPLNKFNINILNLSGGLGNILFYLYLYDAIIPTFAVGIRRMHDIGRSGINFFLPYWGLFLALKKDEKGENEYGANPKGGIQLTNYWEFREPLIEDELINRKFW
ncbi:MAG: DUF805 domain-containing protein [Candidatus Cloacimonetes bacterium]|nr:DUF805 domain-containing protein [Candidatus Cloacimonadota bacterium]